MIRSTPLITLIYAILVILLGFMGYTAGSMISLIIAGALGLLIIVCLGLVIFTQKEWPYYLAMADIVLLLGFFSYKFATTQGFSWGAMAAFSFLVLILIGIKAFSHREI